MGCVVAPNVDDLVKASQAAAKKSAAVITAAKQVAATVAAARPIPPDPYPAGEKTSGTPAGGVR